MPISTKRWGRPYLTDECTATITGSSLPRRIGVDYNELGKEYRSISGVIENARVKPFYGRARLLASGRLNDDGSGEDLYTFEIDEYLDFQPLVPPYQGLLKPSWTYAGTGSRQSHWYDQPPPDEEVFIVHTDEVPMQTRHWPDRWPSFLRRAVFTIVRAPIQ